MLGDRKGSGFLDAYSRKSYRNREGIYSREVQNDSKISNSSQNSSHVYRAQNQSRYQSNYDEYITEEETFRTKKIVNKQQENTYQLKESRQRDTRSVFDHDMNRNRPYNYKSFGAI